MSHYPTRAEAAVLATDPAYLAAARSVGAKDGTEWTANYTPGGPWFARGSANETPHLAAYHREWRAGFDAAISAKVAS